MGGDLIFERLKDHLDVGNDETTEDGKVTLEHIECNAACDYAPVMMVNWEFMDNQTPESAVQVVDDLRAGKEVHSTRGPRLCTWREAERVLAGFPDDRADEGPAAGPASLVGLKIARENGWTAPRRGRTRERTRDRHTHPGPHRQLGRRARLDPGVVRGARRLRRPRQGVRDGARRRDQRRQGVRPPRPRRRRLPHRHEVGLHPAGQPRSRSTSSSTPTSPSRAPARTSR